MFSLQFQSISVLLLCLLAFVHAIVEFPTTQFLDESSFCNNDGAQSLLVGTYLLIHNINRTQVNLTPGNSIVNLTTSPGFTIDLYDESLYPISSGNVLAVGDVPAYAPYYKYGALFSTARGQTVYYSPGSMVPGAPPAGILDQIQIAAWNDPEYWPRGTTTISVALPRRYKSACADVHASTFNRGYCYGGISDATTNLTLSGTQQIQSSDLTLFDTNTQAVALIPNTEQSRPYSDSWSEPYQGFGGSLNHIDNGVNDGVLIVAGRWTFDTDGSTKVPNNLYHQVAVYDITSKRWFNQKTSNGTGVPPSGNYQYCTVMTQSTDNNVKSWEIFFFGEYDNGQLYILSIPSFTWHKGPVAPNVRIGRSGMTCTQSAGYMLVSGGTSSQTPCVGGVVPLALPLNDGQATALGHKKTETIYDGSTVYRRSTNITSYIQQNQYPSTWSDPALKGIFVDGVGPSQNSFNSSTNGTSNTNNTNTNANTKASSVPLKVLVPSVIGGAIFIIILVCLAIFCIRRRQRRDHPYSPNSDPYIHEAPVTSVKHELPNNYYAPESAVPALGRYAERHQYRGSEAAYMDSAVHEVDDSPRGAFVPRKSSIIHHEPIELPTSPGDSKGHVI